MRKLTTPTLAALVALFGLAGAACQSGSSSASSSNSSEAAASVNGTKITVADVDRATKQQLNGQDNQLAPLELATARMQSLDSLITQEVLYQRAVKENIKPTDEEINTFVSNLKSQGGLTEDAFQRQLKEANQTEAQFREDVRKRLAIQKLNDKLGTQIKVKDSEVEEFFKANPSMFVAEPGVQVSDIIVDPRDNGAKNDAKGEAAAQQKIQTIFARLKSGSDFATVARGESEHQSAYRSGDLGFIPQTQFGALAQQGLPANLGAELMGKSEGDIVGPIKDQSGIWHIFKLTGKRTEKRDLTLNDPEVRKQINDAILEQRKQLVDAALVTRARDEAKIENYLAQRLLENPNSLGVLRPTSPAAPSPAASAAASPKK